MRSSPHVRFAVAIVAISSRRSAGIGGRPAARDFQRQNSRKPFRCQRMSVSGSTMVSKRRHSTIRDKATSVMRVASSARRGFTCRSKYNANCFRRNRFSAASWARDRNADAISRATSTPTRRMIRIRMRGPDWGMTSRILREHHGQMLITPHRSLADQERRSEFSDQIFADHKDHIRAHAFRGAKPKSDEFEAADDLIDVVRSYLK